MFKKINFSRNFVRNIRDLYRLKLFVAFMPYTKSPRIKCGEKYVVSSRHAMRPDGVKRVELSVFYFVETLAANHLLSQMLESKSIIKDETRRSEAS